MSAPWMPLYVADYLADTGHLTTLEHGAYLLLIMTYWRRGGLPDDDAQLARIARMTTDEWLNVRSTIVQLFHDGWSHKRIDAELARASEKAEKASFAGKRSAEARKGQRTFNGRSTDVPTERQPSQSQSQSQEEPSNEGSKPAPKIVRTGWSTSLADDAEPTDTDIAIAAEYRLTGPPLAEEWKHFRSYQVSHANRSFNWPETFRQWLIKRKNFERGSGTTSAIAAPIAEPTGFYAKLDSAEWNAWNAHLRDTKNKPAPLDKKGGWRFPARWPPGHREVA